MMTEPSDFTEIDSFISYLFSDLPKDPMSIKFVPISDEPDEEEVTLVFEMLINIYMEGMIDVERLINMISTKKVIDKDDEIYEKKINIHKINSNLMEFVKPWFLSIGYHVNIIEYDSDSEESNILKDYLKNYYCKIIFRDNPHDYGIFFFRKINKPYHFVLNGEFKQVKDLKDMFAVFIQPKNPSDDKSTEKIYSVSFSPVKK
jgi:hypothetical protein